MRERFLRAYNPIVYLYLITKTGSSLALYKSKKRYMSKYKSITNYC